MADMSSPVTAFSSGLSLMPADLDRTQRGMLIGLVVLVHAALGAGLWLTHEPALVTPPSSAIEVSLIAEEPAVDISAPRPVPAPPEPVPARQPVAAPRVPVPSAPPVLASTAPAQPSEVQVPVAAPEVPLAPAAPAAEQQAAPAPVAPAPVSTAPVARAPMQPKDMPSSSVRYLVEPPQVYPRVSRELGETGVVKLRLLIDEQGRLKRVEVAQSSGYPRLDQQAVANLRQARFQPFVDNGVPREVTTTASIVFSLEEQ